MQPSAPAAGQQLRHRRLLGQACPSGRVTGRDHSGRRPSADFQPVRRDGVHLTAVCAGNLWHRNPHAARRRLDEKPRHHGRPFPERPPRSGGVRPAAEGRRLRPEFAMRQRWWNPAVENQATDRAFLIGQTKDVHVHKMICAGTLEDRIDLRPTWPLRAAIIVSGCLLHAALIPIYWNLACSPSLAHQPWCQRKRTSLRWIRA